MYEEVNGYIIGGDFITGQLYSNDVQVGPRFYGEDDYDVIKSAKIWFGENKDFYPDGLELRIR